MNHSKPLHDGDGRAHEGAGPGDVDPTLVHHPVRAAPHPLDALNGLLQDQEAHAMAWLAASAVPPGEPMRVLRDSARELRSQAEQARRQVQRQIQDRPLTAVALAVLAGGCLMALPRLWHLAFSPRR
ncbi:hypothetical protein [Curvibacter gracilis]|uniref:hypothetical protein n=1 Tax=Curvibacter gracilis TaxID=230310 RepID=UPI0004876A0C|nr:hypothetical protein [Curvibacter gracilis]